MEQRRFGRSDLQVSAIGFGAWGIGKGWWGEHDDRESVRALCRALELGVTFIDTAYAYGDGHSERLIAEAFRRSGRRVFVATKVPLRTEGWPPPPGTRAAEAFPARWIIDHTERSLTNLETDCLDLQQLHIWRDEWLREEEWLLAIERLKTQGKTRRFGVSIIDHRPDTALEIVRSGIVDSVQVIYNIFDQSPERELFPLCQQRDVAVIARVPFDEGSLAGTLAPDMRLNPDEFQGSYFRGDRLKETCRRVELLKQYLNEDATTLPIIALKFCLSNPTVSTVIPGMRRTSHVEANVLAGDGKPLPSETLKALKAHAWPRNYYQ